MLLAFAKRRIARRGRLRRCPWPLGGQLRGVVARGEAQDGLAAAAPVHAAVQALAGLEEGQGVRDGLRGASDVWLGAGWLTPGWLPADLWLVLG